MSLATDANSTFEALKRHSDLVIQHAGHVLWHVNTLRKAFLVAGVGHDLHLMSRAHDHLLAISVPMSHRAVEIQRCGPGFARIDKGELGGRELEEFLKSIVSVPVDTDRTVTSCRSELLKARIQLDQVAGEHHDLAQAQRKLGLAERELTKTHESSAAAAATYQAFRSTIKS